MGKEAPHCGFPEAALPKYAEKLVALGHKVGVVEQMETPAQLEERNKKRKEAGQRVDKAVRREICSVLTQGTAPPQGAQAKYVLFVCEDLPSKTLGRSAATFVGPPGPRAHAVACASEKPSSSESHSSKR